MAYDESYVTALNRKKRATVPVGAAGQPDFKQGPAYLPGTMPSAPSPGGVPKQPGTDTINALGLKFVGQGVPNLRPGQTPSQFPVTPEPPAQTTFPTAEARVLASRLRSAGMRNLQYTPDRETRIQNRYDIEDQLRPLDQALAPQQRVPTPQGLEAATLALRSQLARARAERGMQDAAPLPNADVVAGQRAAYGTGAARPMTNPSDEMARQGMLSLAGREPVLSNNELTTPGDLERRRRAFVAPQQRPVEEVLPLPTPEGADRSITAAQTRNADIIRAQQATGPESATGVLERAASQRNFRREMGTKGQELTRAKMQSAIDAGGVEGTENQINLLNAKTRLAAAQRTSEAGRPLAGARLPTSLGTVERNVEANTGLGGITERFAPWFLSPLAGLASYLFNVTPSASRDQKIDVALKDIENNLPNLTFEERTAAAERMKDLRDKIVGQPYTEAYVDRIQRILASLDSGVTR